MGHDVCTEDQSYGDHKECTYRNTPMWTGPTGLESMYGRRCMHTKSQSTGDSMNFKEPIVLRWNVSTKDQYYMGTQCVYSTKDQSTRTCCMHKKGPMHDAYV